MTNRQERNIKDPQTNGKDKIRQRNKNKGTYTQKQNQKSPQKTKNKRVTQWAKENQNDINQFKTKLNKTQNRKQAHSRLPT